jgi:hypothetical protein
VLESSGQFWCRGGGIGRKVYSCWVYVRVWKIAFRIMVWGSFRWLLQTVHGCGILCIQVDSFPVAVYYMYDIVQEAKCVSFCN